MIVQNPIVGRSRKKLAGVYARTLWGKNIIQSCPSPSNIPPTQALSDSRAAFGKIMQMANMVPKSLLYNIYYTAPVGRSRRHVLSSQLFTGVQRNEMAITFDLSNLSEIGTNLVATKAGLLHTFQGASETLPISAFSATELADTTRVPCVMAVSYDLGLAVSLLDYTEVDGDDLVFSNLSETLFGHEVLLVSLWQVNMGTPQTPVWQFGAFKLDVNF